VAVSIPIDRIRRLTPFFSSRSIIATRSATDRANRHILVTTRESPDRANEIASSKALRGPRALVCSRHRRGSPLSQQISLLSL
jgi:hypothetical protein